MPDADRAKGYVEAAMSYIIDTGKKPVSATDGPGTRTHTHTGTYEDCKVQITDFFKSNRVFPDGFLIQFLNKSTEFDH